MRDLRFFAPQGEPAGPGQDKYVWAYYNVTSTTEATRLLYGASPNFFTGDMIIDGVIRTSRATTYTFPTTGIHLVKWRPLSSGLSGAAFRQVQGLVMCYLPKQVTDIPSNYFYQNSNLETLVCMSPTPPTFGNFNYTFTSGCPSIIYVPYSADHSILNAYKAATGWSSLASRIYELCADDSIPIIFEDPVVEQICVDNFTNNNGHVSYEDAARVSSIGNSVFATNTQITSFKELIYFTGLTSIHYSVFRACTNLSTIGIPPTVQSIGMTGPPIEHIYISNLNSFLTLTHSSYSLTHNTPDTGAHLYVNNVEVNSIVFPEGTTSIPASCLRRIRVTSVTMPNTVTEIGAEAFGYCPLLSNVPLSTSLENLGNSCFRNCTSLTSEVSFPSTLKTIGTNVYIGSNISGSVIIPEGVTSIGTNAFRAVPLTGIVDLPSTILSIGNMAFMSLEKKATAFIIRATTPPTLGGTSALSKIPIYVPYSSDHSILSAYQTAQYWSSYASYMSELNPDGTVPTT